MKRCRKTSGPGMRCQDGSPVRWQRMATEADMQALRVATLVIAAALALLGSASARAADEPMRGPAQPPSALSRIEQGLERGAKAAAAGIERGLQAAEHGVRTGAAAAARGIEIGAHATARAADRIARQLKRATQPQPAPPRGRERPGDAPAPGHRGYGET